MTSVQQMACSGVAAGLIALAMPLANPARAAPTSEEQACELGPCLPSQPRPFLVLSGRFAVGYQQIYCIRAPCPPGGRVVVFPDRMPIRVGTVAFAPGTPKSLQLFFNTGDPRRRYVRFDGTVTIAPDKSNAVIRPRSAAYNASVWPRSPALPRR